MDQYIPLVGFYKLHEEAVIPEQATTGSACVDINCCLKHVSEVKGFDTLNRLEHVRKKFDNDGTIVILLKPWHRLLVPTGLIGDFPDGYSYRGHPRSGMAIKQGVTVVNCEPVVDSDYVNEMFVPLINLSNTDCYIAHGDRIAQFELHKDVVYETMELLNPPSVKTNRGMGGFGSTGKN